MLGLPNPYPIMHVMVMFMTATIFLYGGNTVDDAVETSAERAAAGAAPIGDDFAMVEDRGAGYLDNRCSFFLMSLVTAATFILHGGNTVIDAVETSAGRAAAAGAAPIGADFAMVKGRDAGCFDKQDFANTTIAKVEPSGYRCICLVVVVIVHLHGGLVVAWVVCWLSTELCLLQIMFNRDKAT